MKVQERDKAESRAARRAEVARRFDEDLRGRVRSWSKGDEFRAGDRVTVVSGLPARMPGQERGRVVGPEAWSASGAVARHPRHFVVELDEALPHGRRVVALSVTRIERDVTG